MIKNTVFTNGQEEKKNFVPVYEIFVHAFEPIALYRDGIEMALDERDALQKSMLRTAIRAAYRRGIDAACVRLSYLGERKFRIKRIRSCYGTNVRDVPASVAAKLEQAKQKQFKARMLNRQRQGLAKIGADIEFLICNAKGQIVPAGRLLPHRGKAGADAVWLNDQVHYVLAELRPDPAITVEELFDHLLKAMRLAWQKMTRSDIVWLAGGMPKRGHPLGGHLHFSRIFLDVEFIKVLDNYLLLPLVLLESKTTVKRRRNYGRVGEIERKAHGGFEYRSLPSWIMSPEIALGVLASARFIADHYWQMPARPLSDRDIYDAFRQGDKATLFPVVKKLWADIKGMRGYAMHESLLTPLWKKIIAMDDWEESKCILPAWVRLFPESSTKYDHDEQGRDIM